MAFALAVMLSVGEGFSAPTRLERVRVFTKEKYSRGAILTLVTQVPGTPLANPNRGSHRIVFWILAALSLLFFLLHLGLGSTDFVSPIGVVRELIRGQVPDDSANAIVWAIRMPKALYCVLAGGILGVVGSAFQALFRNPLAEPYTVGVASGAAVGGAIAQIIGLDAGFAFLGTPLLGFAGGMLSLLLVLSLARRRTGTDTTTLLLAGVVVSALLSALLSVVVLMSGADTNRLMRWLLGSTSPQYWERVCLMAAVLVPGTYILWRQTRNLNAFAIGEDTARRLGVDPTKLKWTVLTTGTAMAATAVGTVGAIAFLGLVAPHISRRLLGVDWRRSLTGSLMCGSSLMLAADVVAQRALPWIGHALTGRDLLATDLPVGVVTALLGAPSLLILLRKEA
jgi:iron complex transport system permease protein